MEQINRVVVVGAGTMGSQIALQTAYSGRYEVALIDSNPEQLTRARAQNQRLARRAAEKGRLTAEQAEAALARIQSGTDLAPLADADLVIEAIFEDLGAKRALWREMGKRARPDAILTTNSSTIVVSRLVDLVPRPERCCNLHFFHPVTVLELCEVVRGPRTGEETVRTVMEFVRSIGRVPVLITKEIHGFVVNRILLAALEEAFRLLEGGYASVEDIDLAVRKGLNWPMGPFELLDFSGLDVFQGIWRDRVEQEGGTGVPATLAEKVRRGELGRKTGRGFYEYATT